MGIGAAALVSGAVATLYKSDLVEEFRLTGSP